MDVLLGDLFTLSKNKYASNVIEKCLKYGGFERAKDSVLRVFSSDRLITFVTDKFANFVVQKLLEAADQETYCFMIQKLKGYEMILRKTALGKYILKAIKKK